MIVQNFVAVIKGYFSYYNILRCVLLRVICHLKYQ
jgi:hypothetical protein